MQQQNTPSVQVSQQYRWLENAHIFLWLIKDTCWALEFEPGGLFMILPTVTVAFYLTWKSWMLGEFVEHEARPYAVVLFLCGLGVLLFYYIFYFRKDNRKNVTLE